MPKCDFQEFIFLKSVDGVTSRAIFVVFLRASVCVREKNSLSLAYSLRSLTQNMFVFVLDKLRPTNIAFKHFRFHTTIHRTILSTDKVMWVFSCALSCLFSQYFLSIVDVLKSVFLFFIVSSNDEIVYECFRVGYDFISL